ncbi:MAG: S-methyl-5'-thioadenosine phosphorylase [Luteolibacter sp.]
MNLDGTKEPALGVIGGSGLYEIDGLENVIRHEISTPFGKPSDPIIEGSLSGRRVCFLPRHGVGHRLMPHEIPHRANLWALRSLNVRWLLSVSAVGSLREEMPPRDIVVPDQLIDRTATAAKHTFFGEGIAAHVGFADPYCPEMRKLVTGAALAHTEKIHPGGTYLCMNGPAFSSRAEAAMHRLIGADIIGMTNGPEARLAREAEIAAATLALVTDYDCWKEDEEAVEVSTVIGNLHANSEMAKRIIGEVAARLPESPTGPFHQVLDTAIFTPRSAWPAATVEKLAPILARFR